MLMQKSKEFNIDLNSKSNDGWTAFHFACAYDKINIVEMMIDNAKSFKLDLLIKDNNGRTGFQCAKDCGSTDVVKIIKRKMPKIAL